MCALGKFDFHAITRRCDSLRMLPSPFSGTAGCFANRHYYSDYEFFQVSTCQKIKAPKPQEPSEVLAVRPGDAAWQSRRLICWHAPNSLTAEVPAAYHPDIKVTF